MTATTARNITSNKKDLSSEQREELRRALKARFEKNMSRHKGLEWARVQAKLEVNAEKLLSLNEMGLWARIRQSANWRGFQDFAFSIESDGLGDGHVAAANRAGAGIVQVVGPLKSLADKPSLNSGQPSRRFLIITDLKDSSQIVLRQSSKYGSR
jgi:hypothetical protein